MSEDVTWISSVGLGLGGGDPERKEEGLNRR